MKATIRRRGGGLLPAGLIAALLPAVALAQDPIPPLPELQFVRIEPGRTQLGGDRISYLAAGKSEAPAIVLLHGIGAHAGGFRYQIAALSDTYRVIAWNAPGYILSENLKPDWPKCADYAEVVAAMLDALALRKVYVLGSSLGTMHAACFAAKYPDRVAKLVLIGTPMGLAGAAEAEVKRALAAREKRILDEGPLLNAQASMVRLAGPKASPAAKGLMLEMLKAINRPGYIQAGRMVIDVDMEALARAIKAPTLLIHGRDDRNAPLADAEKLAKFFTDARVAVLDGHGHLPEIEAPQAVAALLRDFLR